MTRLIWMVLGFMGGVSMARNAQAMNAPSVGAVGLVLVVGCGVCWFAAYRGKSQVVASAVAVAVASAEATASAAAESRAQAIAQAAVHLHLGGLDSRGLVAEVVEREEVPAQAPAGLAKRPAARPASLEATYQLGGPRVVPHEDARVI